MEGMLHRLFLCMLSFILFLIILKEDWLAVGPWFVLWLFTVTGLIYRSCYGIEIDCTFEDQTFAPSRTRSTAESQPSIGT